MNEQRAETATRERERKRDRGTEEETERERKKKGRVTGGKRNAGTPRANHSRRSPNNLLVFHVRFDSLSFRYLYLSDLLRISGICAANERETQGKMQPRRGARNERSFRIVSLLRQGLSFITTIK